METYKVKIKMPGRKRAISKTVLATEITIATTMIINYVYREVCNHKRSKLPIDYFLDIDVFRESDKEVELNLFISRMDQGKELNINLHFKKITTKNETFDGIIISEKLLRCNAYWKGETVFINM